MEATIKDLEKIYKNSYNWDKLKFRLQDWMKFLEECDKELILGSYKKEIGILKVILDDMQELEQGKDE